MTFSGQQRVWIDLFCIETNVMCCVQMLTFRMLDPRKISRFQPLLHSRFPLAIRVKVKLNWVILPFLTGCIRRIHAAIFSFCAGVMPPTLCRAVGLSSQARTTMSSWLRSGVLAWR